MHLKSCLCLTLLLVVFGFNVYAEYNMSGQMTQAEYQKVRESSAAYNACLNEFAMTQLQGQSDVRVIADHAMKKCATHLENLYADLLLGDYAPVAVQRFVTSISNKYANQLLSNIMRYKAAQSQ